jgi:hypothetical protein
MKTLQRLSLLTFAMLAMRSAALASNAVDPSEVYIKVYETRISANADCSGGFVRIFQDASPTAQNFLSSPSIGSGAAPRGTYNCVAIRMSDQIAYKPAETTTGSNCVAGASLTQDIMRGEVSLSPDGDSTTTAIGEDIVWIYLSTTGTEAATCTRPSERCLLGSPLVIGGDRRGTFVVDFRSQVQDHGSSCSLEGPTFSFR